MATPEEAVDTAVDYASHKRQFDRFLHILKWFVIHALLMLAGLYYLVIEGEAVAGTLFVLLAVAVISYGIFTISSVARDVVRAVDHRRDAS